MFSTMLRSLIDATPSLIMFLIIVPLITAIEKPARSMESDNLPKIAPDPTLSSNPAVFPIPDIVLDIGLGLSSDSDTEDFGFAWLLRGGVGLGLMSETIYGTISPIVQVGGVGGGFRFGVQAMLTGGLEPESIFSLFSVIGGITVRPKAVSDPVIHVGIGAASLVGLEWQYDPQTGGHAGLFKISAPWKIFVMLLGGVH